MSSKEDDSEYKSEGKFDGDYDSKEDKECDEYRVEPPKINILSIKINPHEEVEFTSSLQLKIAFELDRDVVAAYWVVQFLVDSSHKRVIKVLGETAVEDYPDGESDMSFSVDQIDVTGISPSTLTNSGLLMAKFMVDGDEVASVNMVDCIDY
jgi:hypothetical protein